MRSQAPLTIAIRLRDWSSWCRLVVRGIQRYAHDRPHWKPYVEADSDQTSRLQRGEVRADGIITSVLTPPGYWQRMINAGTPHIVGLTAAIPRKITKLHRVGVNELKVATAITQHFLNAGYRRVAYCSGTEATTLDNRRAGMASAAGEANVPCAVYDYRGVPGRVPTVASLTQWVSRLETPVGIAAWNTDLARRLVEACRRTGVSIPEQVAVVSWDDDAFLAEMIAPTISGVVMPAEQLGFEAARLLDRLMSGQGPGPQPVLIDPPHILHLRQSSDALTLKDRAVHLAVQYIGARAREPISVASVCSALDVPRRRLEIRFREVMGRTLGQEITAVRLQHARQLLLETDWPLQRVAAGSGLGTRRTLHRLFLTHERVTPGEYREKSRSA